MIDKDFRDKLNNVCDAVEQAHGDVNLFAALKMDELTDKWTIVVSAPWVAENNFEKLFTEIRDHLLKELSEQMSSIARIGLFNLDNHLTKLMIGRFKSGDFIDTDEQINGNLVHEGYIIKVTQPSESE